MRKPVKPLTRRPQAAATKLTTVQVRLPSDLIAALDAYLEGSMGNMTRATAIREVVQTGLIASGFLKPRPAEDIIKDEAVRTK